MTRLATLIVLALGFIACGPGPKPAALVQFEQLRGEPAVQGMKAAAPKIWKDSNNYYRLAFEAWEDSDDDESKEYSLLGTVLYHTAREKADKASVEAEMGAFKEQLTEGRKLRDDWLDKRRTKEEAVSALMGELKAANQLVASEERRGAEAAKFKDQMAKDAKVAEVRQRHSDLLTRLKETEAINAPRHAPGDYNRAKNLLNKAGYELEDGNTNKARDTLEQAATSIATALDVARPKFEEISKKESQAEEDQALIAKAHSLGANDVRVEPRGAVVVVNGISRPARRPSSPRSGFSSTRSAP